MRYIHFVKPNAATIVREYDKRHDINVVHFNYFQSTRMRPGRALTPSTNMYLLYAIGILEYP